MGGLSKRDVNILLIVFGLAVAIAAYFLLFLNFTSEADQLDAETAGMRPRIEQLRTYELSVPTYDEAIAVAKETIAAEKALYTDMVLTEDLVMYLVKLEKTFGLSIEAATFSEPELLSSFVAIDEAGESKVYYAFNVSMSLTTNIGYEALKSALTMIYETPDRTLLDTMTVAVDTERGDLAVSMVINKVFLNDGMYYYAPPDVPDGPIGTPDPFATLFVTLMQNPDALEELIDNYELNSEEPAE